MGVEEVQRQTLNGEGSQGTDGLARSCARLCFAHVCKIVTITVIFDIQMKSLLGIGCGQIKNSTNLVV